MGILKSSLCRNTKKMTLEGKPSVKDLNILSIKNLYVDQVNSINSSKSSEDNNNNAAKIQPIVDFNDMLQRVGTFGPFQIIIMVFVAFSTLAFNVVYLSQQFMVLTPQYYWCNIPELKHMTMKERLELAIPIMDVNLHTAEIRYENCLMYDLNYTEVAAGFQTNYSSVPIVHCRHGIEYNFTGYYHTITTDFDWVCGNDWKPCVAQSLFFVGSAIGTIAFSFLSDRFGRRTVFIISTLWAAVFGVASAFSWDFTSFAVFRALVGFSYQQIFTSITVLAVEFAGIKYRTFIVSVPVLLISGPFAACLPWIAFTLKHWRLYTIILHAPLSLVIFGPLLLPESARWRISRGDIKRVIRDLKFVARLNHKKISPESFNQFEVSVEYSKSRESMKIHSFWELVTTPNVRKWLFLMCFVWGIQALVYDIVVRNTDNLGMDPYVCYSMASLTEIPAGIVAFFALEYLGRRWSSSFSLMLASALAFSSLAVFKTHPVVFASLATIIRFFLTISFKTIYQIQAEVYPTVVRSQGMGFTEVLGHLVTLLAPFVIYLGKSNAYLPIILVGSLCCMSAIIVLLFPETLNKCLPETMDDVKTFGKDQSFLNFPPLERCTSSKKCSRQGSFITVL